MSLSMQDGSTYRRFTYLTILKEDVLSFHVSVQYFALVEVQQGQCHLRKKVYDLNFWKVLSLARARFNLGVDVATVAIHHDDV